MWKSILSDTAYANKVHEIAAILTDQAFWKNAPGLYNGMSGVALFLSYYDDYCKSNEHQFMMEEIISNCFECIESNWAGSNFCSGLSGILWVIKHLASKEKINIDNDFSDLDELLINEMHVFAKNRHFDFLHGSNGIFYYLLQEPEPNNVVTLALQAQIGYLREGSLSNGRQVFWESYINPTDPKKVLNLSLSHGMASTVVFLSMFAKKFPENEEAQFLLRGVSSFLMSSRNPKTSEYYSLYPGTIPKDGQFGNSRMGWCYGDVGHAVGMHLAASICNEESWKEEARMIMQHSAGRRDLKRDLVRDAGICHGTAGLAHIFNRFYQYFGENEFHEAALFWYDETLKMATFSDGLAGYKMLHGQAGWRNEIDMLEGIAGIGLTLLAGLDNREPVWDAALLISKN